MIMNLEKIDHLIASCENGVAPVTREDLVALRVVLVQQQAETARLDVLASHPRLAEIVIDGESKDCVMYAVSGVPGMKLREILDAMRPQKGGAA
jgi:hypothetical protein